MFDNRLKAKQIFSSNNELKMILYKSIINEHAHTNMRRIPFIKFTIILRLK